MKWESALSTIVHFTLLIFAYATIAWAWFVEGGLR
jgi:hypothetical protein